jgi:hypothetical protein
MDSRFDLLMQLIKLCARYDTIDRLIGEAIGVGAIKDAYFLMDQRREVFKEYMDLREKFWLLTEKNQSTQFKGGWMTSGICLGQTIRL